MPELVGRDVAESGGVRGAGEFRAHRVLGKPAAVVGEKEIGGPAGARMRERPARRAGLGDAVEQVEGVVVEGDHPLGVELAERDLQPASLGGDLVDAVELEVEQFADAQAAGTLEQQRVGREPVG
ncbi:hypothetical protein BCD48_18430 [Pseudofrankia sp. BMG5.36]|nr:hypothetical protein [Pseudofrankia sp. BMG5.36]OHV47346.1 hypothetical protein BCD48_18430 [Pseudofrankia sp. BMG5.36]